MQLQHIYLIYVIINAHSTEKCSTLSNIKTIKLEFKETEQLFILFLKQPRITISGV